MSDANLPTCTLCDGEGWTDDNEDVFERAPWSFWETLPPGSDLAVRMGLVKRVPCIRCGESDNNKKEVSA